MIIYYLKKELLNSSEDQTIIFFIIKMLCMIGSMVLCVQTLLNLLSFI